LPVNWLGIQHWQGCNLDCNYCSLNTRRSSPRRPPAGTPLSYYKVGETIQSLIAEKQLDANAVIDWGGGGEPLLMPEFDSAFRLLARWGAEQWLHTNATVFPASLKKGAIDPSRVHVICSLDSGTRETYRRVKGPDLYARVWQNLHAYSLAGAEVYAKYIVLPDNSSRLDLQSFVNDAARFGRPILIGDIDLKTREVSDSIVEALAFLQRAAQAARLRFQLGGLCMHSALGNEVQRRVALVASTMHVEEPEPESVRELEYLHKVAVSKAKWQRRSWIKRTFHRWRPPQRSCKLTPGKSFAAGASPGRDFCGQPGESSPGIFR